MGAHGVGSPGSVVATSVLYGPSVNGSVPITRAFAKQSLGGVVEVQGVGVAVGVSVGVSVGTGVSVAVSVGTGVSVAVSVGTGVSVAVFVGVAVSVAVLVGVAVLVLVGVGVTVGVFVLVGVGVIVGVLVLLQSRGGLLGGPHGTDFGVGVAVFFTGACPACEVPCPNAR